MAEPTAVNSQVTDAVTAVPSEPAHATIEQLYELHGPIPRVALAWDPQRRRARFHVECPAHAVSIPVRLPVGSPFLVTISDEVELGGAAQLQALAAWIRETLGADEEPADEASASGTALRCFLAADEGHSVSLVWDPEHERASIRVEARGLAAHVPASSEWSPGRAVLDLGFTVGLAEPSDESATALADWIAHTVATDE